MSVEYSKAGQDLAQGIVVGEAQVLTPQLADLAHPAAIGLAPVEQLLDQQRPVVPGHELGERIVVPDAVGRQESETGARTGFFPRLSQALQDGERLRADERGVDEVCVTETAAEFDVPLHLMVVGGDAFGPRSCHRWIVADDDIVEGFGAIGFEGHLDDARGALVIQQVEGIVPEHARLVIVAMPSRQHRVSHGPLRCV